MTLHIGFLIYDNVTQLDATGPAQVLSQLPDARIHMVARSKEPVATDAGFALLPTDTFDECPQLDVICVPGGPGQITAMQNVPTLEFLQRQGSAARYVTSVCSGALLLGAAGLLKGYKSACHWAFIDRLPMFGAEPVAARIVRDRNRMSGGGVTAGIDFGLALAAEIAGEDMAKRIQLFLEYDPAPPFDAGSPAKAGPVIEADVRATFAALSSQT